MSYTNSPESEQSAQVPPFNIISILYVDDEPGILDAVKITLEDTGRCKVDTAQTVTESLDKLEKFPYDAIIADYVMPDIDGIRFLQIVRERYGEIPFILYTGVEREEVLIDAINNGVNYYFQKGGDPIPQFADLLHVIEQAVMRRRAEISLRESELKLKSRNQDLMKANEKLSQTLQDLTSTENELATRNKELREQQEDLNKSYSALREANRQLNLLSSITRHDILNKVTILNGFISIIKEEIQDKTILEYLDIIETTTNTIQSQIAFTRIYQDLGTQQPRWIPVQTLMSVLNIPGSIKFSSDIDDLEIFTDPISGKVFENLLDNTIRHGQNATRVTVSSKKIPEGMAIIWKDNGIGIPVGEKEKIFERGYGKNTGLGLFLVREILSITGIQIRENGIEKEGAQFEILIPEGKYRIIKN